MKTTRTYLSGCTWCGAKGFVDGRSITTTSVTEVCPVCNGAKTIVVTETIESELASLKQEQNVPSNQEGKTAEEGKDRIAIKWGYLTWNIMLDAIDKYGINRDSLSEIMEEYRKLPLQKDEECNWFDECQGRNKCTKPR